MNESTQNSEHGEFTDEIDVGKGKINPEISTAEEIPVDDDDFDKVEKRREKIKAVLSEVSIIFQTGDGEEIVTFSPEEITVIANDKDITNYLPETLRVILPERFITNVKIFSVTPTKWKLSALKQPSLFY